MINRSPFGEVVTAKKYRDAMAELIRVYSPSYLAEAARQVGRPPDWLPRFRSYSFGVTDTHWVDDQLPGVKIIVPGITDVERRSQQLDYHWAIGVGLIVSGNDFNSTLMLAETYAAVVRMLVVQHPSLGVGVEATYLMDERYDEIVDDEQHRTLMGVSLQFDAVVNNVVDSSLGPKTPPVDPLETPPDVPLITQVRVDIEKETL